MEEWRMGSNQHQEWRWEDENENGESKGKNVWKDIVLEHIEKN